MNEIKIGDFVKGTSNDVYTIANTSMTRGVVTDIKGSQIHVKVIDHQDDESGSFWVDPQHFEVIGHQKPFNRDEVLHLLRNGCKKAIFEYDLRGADLRRAYLSGADLSGADLGRAYLSGADLRGADLRRANLRRADLSGADLNGADLRRAYLSGADLSGADLRRADLDFSCLPLWCGGLRLKIDKRQACQLAYHLCSMQCDDAEFVAMRNSILDFANQFHRVDECGVLEELIQEDKK